MKRCFICQTEKDCSEFRKDAQKSDGFSPYCKTCHSLKIKAKTQKRKKDFQLNSQLPQEKFCIKCEQVKSFSGFHKDYGKSDCLRNYCK